MKPRFLSASIAGLILMERKLFVIRFFNLT
jgi:hypothetical protein